MNEVEFEVFHHEPTLTSEDSAKVRGEELKTGGKALLLKIDKGFKLFVLAADKKLNSKKIKKNFKVKSIRFSTKEELYTLTQLVSGSVPPFGKPILDFELFVDNSICKNEVICFNAGSLEDSIRMKVRDYIKVAKPNEIFDFSNS